MPSVRSQAISILGNSQAIITLDTGRWGILVLSAVRLASNWTLTLTADGAVKASTVLSSPTAAQIENWARTACEALIVDGSILSMKMRLHVVSLNPIVLTVGLFNPDIAVPANWWD